MCTKNYNDETIIPMGLVLEGGSLRGLFTAGVLDYFMEKNLMFQYVVGVSAGACNLLGYVSRQPGHTKDCMVQKDSQNSYYGFNQFIKKGKIIDLDKIFYEYPYREKPFDFDSFFSSPVRYEIVVTNCLDGKPEYLTERKKRERLSAIGKASASMPLFTKMVEIDGTYYMDGGVADSIPIKRAIEQGNKKNVVILTRRKDHYLEMPTYQKLLYEGAYRKYPQLLDALLRRSALYREQMAFLEQEEQKGTAFIIRPAIPEIKRLETNYDALIEYYKHGYTMAKQCWDSLSEFLQSE